MIFRYKVEYEFEAESLFEAQMALNKGKVTEEMAITKALEAIVSEDRIIPRKWVPKKESAVVTFQDATRTGEKPSDDQPEHIRDDPSGTSPETSRSRIALQRSQVSAEEPPF